MGVQLSGEAISRILGNANERAKHEGDSLRQNPALTSWLEHIGFLRLPTTPRTYLAVTATLLAARSLHSRDELDIRAIKASTSDRGYSASSVAGRLASFAKEQRIDLRAKSSQPMNNQPFTFKDYLAPDMSVQDKFVVEWKTFNSIVDEIDGLNPERASEILALLFLLARKVDAPTISVTLPRGGRRVVEDVAASVADFVETHSEGGRVGQAFAAAILDLLYGPDNVVLGDTQDPDASTPGDVQVQDEGGTWLWAEVKQKVVTTGDVQGFMEKVQQAGGRRVLYFALVNSGYSGNIQEKQVQAQTGKFDMETRLFDSPSAALTHFLAVAPGSPDTVASALLERTHARMTEAGCSAALLGKLAALAASVGDVQSG